MKYMKYLVLVALLASTFSVSGQYSRHLDFKPTDYSGISLPSDKKTSYSKCEEYLLGYTLQNYKLIGSLFPPELRSTWLKKIIVFHDGHTYRVIAQMKGKLYVYCDIPKYKLELFLNTNSTISHGVRFNEWIHPHKCDCI